MKKILLFALTVLSMSAQAEILRGGISGGGGGTVIARPASPFLIKEILRDSRLALLMYFNQQTFLENHPYADLFPVGEPSILDVIRKNKLSLVEDQACKDSEGRAVDGSVFGAEENSICISVKNLSEKLSADQARAQTIGLVAHEYSHLVGFDEEKAQALQDRLIELFSTVPSDRARDMLNLVAPQVNWAKVNVYFLGRMTGSQGRESVCHTLKESQFALTTAMRNHYDSRFPFRVWTKEDSLRAAESYMRIGMLVYAKCAGGRDGGTLRLVYDTEFNGQTELPLSHFHSVFGGAFEGKIRPDAMISYIPASTDAVRDTDETGNFAKELERTEEALKFVFDHLNGLQLWPDEIPMQYSDTDDYSRVRQP